ALRDKLRALAAAQGHPLGEPAGGADDGGRDAALAAYAAVLARAQLDAVDADAETAPPEVATTEYTRYSFGAHFCEVRVLPATGVVRVARHVAAFDVGRVLNPRTTLSQLKGGVVWGLGQALTEATHYDPRSGKVVNDNLADYHVPVNADVPDLDAFYVDADDPRELNPLGTKAVGEIATVGAAAAVANAVYHATGVRVRDLPITADRLL
ncbi:MAG TPA: molybdopterin cofactor-binding domain-containing protein, partial [Gemmatirosa sp.]